MNIRQFKIMVAAVILVLAAGFAATEARAENPYMNIPEMQRLSNEARQQWWNSLTPRQRQLVRLVGLVEDQYKTKTRQPYIPLTRQNLRLVVQGIGASEREAGFVDQRMQIHARAGRAIASVDRFLNYAQCNPYWYLPPNMRPF